MCQGQRWHCTGQRCSAWCQASGAPHYVTFDGLVLTFPGACEYLLVREASGRFSVSIQNLPCGASGLTCTKAVTVRLDSTVVHMLRGDCGLSRRAAILPEGGWVGHSSLSVPPRVWLSLWWCLLKPELWKTKAHRSLMTHPRSPREIGKRKFGRVTGRTSGEPG